MGYLGYDLLAILHGKSIRLVAVAFANLLDTHPVKSAA